MLTPHRRVAVLGVAGVVVLAGSGCTADAPSARPGASSAGEAYTARAPLIRPGGPGEPATTLAPGDVGRRAQPVRWNRADLDFVQLMIGHHLQALRMASLAPGRARDTRVRALADRISAAQAPEIAALDAWLAARGQERSRASGKDGHRHAGMPGAVSADQLTGLSRAAGTEFDRRFLDLMLTHHAGAVRMAQDVATSGSDPTVAELAAEVASGQTAEIGRMRDLRAQL